MDNAITVRKSTSDLVVATDLVDRAKSYGAQAQSDRTKHEYERCWRRFIDWCQATDMDPVPCQPGTLGLYITWMADGQGTGRSLSISTIAQAVSAIKHHNKVLGHALDTKVPALQQIMTGIRRNIAKTRTIRRVKPLLEDDLAELLEMLKPTLYREARDAALLGLGFGAALRRIELVGLDFKVLGSGTGILQIDDKGLKITLLTSKSMQDTAAEVIVPRQHVPVICQKVEHWLTMAKLKPGSPVFRAVTGKMAKGNKVAANRLSSRSVGNIIKHRIGQLAKLRSVGRKKMSKADVKALVDAVSGHSMRVGHITSAAERGVPNHHIRQTSRHKTDAMISLYSRSTDAVKNSSLKGSRGL